MGKGNPFKSLGNAFKSVGQSVGLIQKPVKLPKLPQVKAPTGPRQFSGQELGKIKSSLQGGGSLVAPGYLGLDPGMNDLQRRTSIATRAVGGTESGMDKEGLGYYRNLAYGMLGSKDGPLDVEKQFVTEGLGEKILGKGTNEDFLSAIERAYRRMK